MPVDLLNPYVQRLFQIESGGNPDAITGSNRGLGQFGPEEERQYGITDQNRTDLQAQTAAVLREQAAHRGALAKALGGRDPTPGEMYLAHQQGIAGGPALLSAEASMPAWQVIRPFYRSDAIAKQAITGNIPRGSDLHGRSADDISAGDFRQFWVSKFEGGMPGQQPASAPVASAAVPASAAGAVPAGAVASAASPAGMLGMDMDQGQAGQGAASGNANPLAQLGEAMLAGGQAGQPEASAPELPPIQFAVPAGVQQRMLAALRQRMQRGV